jgi:RNA polymerase sigma-70 factor (ECF subfamily)
MGHIVHDTATDQQLLAAAAAKDQAALGALYDRFSRLLYGIIVAVVRDTDDAEDLLQEVFVQIWRNAGSYQPSLGSPKTWLVRIAHNRAIDMLRSKRYQQRRNEIRTDGADSAEQIMAVGAVNDVWQETLRKDSAGRLSRALGNVPDDQRELIEMAFFLGYTHQEISTMSGLPLGTVKTRIRSGIQTLRASLADVADEAVGVN